MGSVQGLDPALWRSGQALHNATLCKICPRSLTWPPAPSFRHSRVSQCQAATYRLFVTATASFRQCCALTPAVFLAASQAVRLQPVTVPRRRLFSVVPFGIFCASLLGYPVVALALSAPAQPCVSALLSAHIAACCNRALCTAALHVGQLRPFGQLFRYPCSGQHRPCATSAGSFSSFADYRLRLHSRSLRVKN